MVSEKLSETIRGMRDSVLDQASESVKIQEKMNEVVTVVKDVNKMNQTANAAAKKVEKSVLDLKQSTQRFVVA
jgi:methyl-accepting chemotaxis protein